MDFKGLGDTAGPAMMSTAIITASATGAAMYATAISTGAVASAGAGAVGAGGGGLLGGALTWLGGLFGFAEGGYSDRPGVGATYSLAPSAFHNAPHFKEGGVTGGGIPAVLHPNEAVIPLSRGRKVPVELSGGGGTKDSGGNTFNLTTHVSVDGGNGSGGGTDAAQMADRIAQTVTLKVQTELANQMRYGGILNPRGR